jgi:hypothetical protein
MTKEKTEPRAYRTLSDVLEMPVEEGAQILARVAPALERFARKSGIFSVMFEMAGTASSEAEAAKMGEEVALLVLRYALGECLEDMQEIIAAINGMSKEDLKKNYTVADVIRMIKSMVGDKGFLSSVRTLIS